MRKGVLTVSSFLPEKLSAVRELSYNLWWSYNPQFMDLLKYIDAKLLERCEQNPIRFFKMVSAQRLIDLTKNTDFMKMYDKLVEKFNKYMSREDTWFCTAYPEYKEKVIAYFSAEYGIHEVLPTYSGGLGVLSGDHLKSASDMGVPLTGVGLFYKHGYFNQSINFEGWQQSGYATLDPSSLPMKLLMKEDRTPLYVEVGFPGRIIFLTVWEVKVGRISLYYLDSDNNKNSMADRDLTSSLYGGNSETRIQQEILMGVGGVRLLELLGKKCDLYHLNEGHQAFVILELLRKYKKEYGMSFEEAQEAVRSKTVFTTHTPVPAGIDVFQSFLVDKYLSSYIEELGITREAFFGFASNFSDTSNFNMAAFALNFSVLKNGVSKLHGKVSRSLFSWLWPEVPVEEVPVCHITNGIHTLSWLNGKLKELFDKYFIKDWENRIYDQDIWDRIDLIPEDEIWRIHREIKREAIEYFRNRIIKRKESVFTSDETDSLLDPDALTIGFARRFATYKRATLVFRDMSRIEKILNTQGRPVQIIFAGKAHPADRQGQELIKRIVDISRQQGFKGKVLFIENYNIEVARYMVQGTDIWLNNPRRPLEASGTSGQKASLNGVVNMSVSDGWWSEGYTGSNGYRIGKLEEYSNQELEDDHDSRSIYAQLENTIIPMFFDLDSTGTPVKWVKIMKEAIKTTAGVFSSDRMIADYTDDMYARSLSYSEKLLSENGKNAKILADYKKRLMSKWNTVNIYSFNGSLELTGMEISKEAPAELFIDLYLADIKPEEVDVELCIEKFSDSFRRPQTHKLDYAGNLLNGCHRYHINVSSLDTGSYIYSFRILPRHELIMNRFDLKMIRWA